jgi:tetratricopeptide (TPR) repeat protein
MSTLERILLGLLFVQAFQTPVMAMSEVEADQLLARAQQSYTTGDHQQALALYDSVSAHFTSAGLLYDIGNCHFKLGDIPHAILYYERAHLAAPGDEDILANLELARQQVADRVNELPSFTLGRSWARFRGGQDSDQWARWSLWACLALFVAMGTSRFVRLRMARVLLHVLAGVALMATLGATALAYTRHAEMTDRSGAIIMAPKVDVRSEPNNASTVLFMLHKGTRVTVMKGTDDWSEVRLANGSVGWMPAKSLERI